MCCFNSGEYLRIAVVKKEERNFSISQIRQQRAVRGAESFSTKCSVFFFSLCHFISHLRAVDMTRRLHIDTEARGDKLNYVLPAEREV